MSFLPLPVMAIAGVVTFLVFTPGLRARTYDLATDWSDTDNPNTAWAYLLGGELGASGVRSGDPFVDPPGAPPIWGLADSPFGWSRSVGTEGLTGGEQVPLDLQTGDVYGHSKSGLDLAITWTSPWSGPIQVSGNTWALRDIGRANRWEITLNGTSLESGILASGDPVDRSHPQEFLFALHVSNGDVIKFNVTPSWEYGNGIDDYLGVNFTVTAVPEPKATVANAALFLVGTHLLRRRMRPPTTTVSFQAGRR